MIQSISASCFATWCIHGRLQHGLEPWHNCTLLQWPATPHRVLWCPGSLRRRCVSQLGNGTVLLLRCFPPDEKLVTSFQLRGVPHGWQADILIQLQRPLGKGISIGMNLQGIQPHMLVHQQTRPQHESWNIHQWNVAQWLAHHISRWWSGVSYNCCSYNYLVYTTPICECPTSMTQSSWTRGINQARFTNPSPGCMSSFIFVIGVM